MNEKPNKSSTASLLTQHSFVRTHEVKQEALALLSFQKTKLERVSRRYKVFYYSLIALCSLLFLYNTTFAAMWTKILTKISSDKNEAKCEGAQDIVDGFIGVHALGLFDIFLCILAGRREKRRLFLFCQIYVMIQLVARIIVFGEYFEFLGANYSCHVQKYQLSTKGASKVLLAVECGIDVIVLGLCSYIIWLLHKVKGIKKLFAVMEKTQSLWDV